MDTKGFSRERYATPKPPGFEHERADCGVRALMVGTGVEYPAAHALLKRQGRKDREGTFNAQMERAALELGAAHFPLPGRYPTVNQFVRDNPRGTFILRLNSHFLAVIDGTVHNWRPVTRAYVYRVWKCN